MRDIDFLTENNYIYIPSKSNPKVILAVGDKKTARNSFKLYNPFSKKGKILKAIYLYTFYNINKITKFLISTHEQTKSEFIAYLEQKLNVTITTSLYFATANDKVVIQIQVKDLIFGYLKYPINKRGIKHLKKEYKASSILEKKNITNQVILFDQYQGVPFLLLKELKGEIKEVGENELNEILKKFRIEEKYQLKRHPRILKLRKKILKKGNDFYLLLLDEICDASEEYYYVVHEHGDFAPWNIISSKEEYFVFDFEFFEKNGLEHLDLIKYYFQVGTLLKNLNSNDLIKMISQKVSIREIDLLMKVFLIKEIIRKTQEKECYQFESDILEDLVNEKT